MFTKQRIAFLLLLATLAGCGDNKNAESTNTTTTESTTEQESAPAADSRAEKAPTAKVHVVVTGGPHAGTYEAVCRTACCSYEIAGEKIFGNQYSESGKKANELSSVQLVVNDVTGNKSTKEFLMTVSFGDMLKDMVSYTIDTQKGKNEGAGTLDLKYANNQGTVQIKGKTKDGIGLEVTLNCDKVYTTQMLTDEIMNENQ